MWEKCGSEFFEWIKWKIEKFIEKVRDTSAKNNLLMQFFDLLAEKSIIKCGYEKYDHRRQFS